MELIGHSNLIRRFEIVGTKHSIQNKPINKNQRHFTCQVRKVEKSNVKITLYYQYCKDIKRALP